MKKSKGCNRRTRSLGKKEVYALKKYNQFDLNTKVARYSKNLRNILSYPLLGLFEYLFIFKLHRHLPAKQDLNSKQSFNGYERIIREILRGPG